MFVSFVGECHYLVLYLTALVAMLDWKCDDPAYGSCTRMRFCPCCMCNACLACLT